MNAASTDGTSSSAALMIVQFRPPNTATAIVYGSRSTDPTSVGIATRKNFPATSRPNGPFGMNSTRTDHSDQIENPMCSEKTEIHRLRVAILLPIEFQNDSSSGRQSSIQRPLRRAGVAVPESVAGSALMAGDGKDGVLRGDVHV